MPPRAIRVAKNFIRGQFLRYATPVMLRSAVPEVVVFLQHLRSKGTQIFPRKNVFVAQSVPCEPVLILAPHHDDEAIGMGGTLSLHLANGSPVTVLFLTDGGSVLQNPERSRLSATRRREAEAVGARYRIRQIFWDKPDTRLTNDPATVAELVEVLRSMRPATVYLPSFFDSQFDHFAVNQILVDALRQLPGLRPTVAGYEVWDQIAFPNYVVDISMHFERKKEMLGHYVTPLQVRDFTGLCALRNGLHYVTFVNPRGQGYAEAFLRFDSRTYQELYMDYVAALRSHDNPLPSRLTPCAVAEPTSEANVHVSAR